LHTFCVELWLLLVDLSFLKLIVYNQYEISSNNRREILSVTQSENNLFLAEYVCSFKLNSIHFINNCTYCQHIID